MTPEQRKRRISSERKRALFGAVAGGTTLAAAGMALAPRAAKLALRPKVAARLPKSVTGGAQRVSANADRWKDRANDTWLYGSIPGAATGLMAASATAADAREDARRLRRDGSMRPSMVAKRSDMWQEHVSDSAMRGHAYLRDGARRDRRNGNIAYAGGLAAVGAAPVAQYATRRMPVKRSLPIVAGASAAGVGAYVAGARYSDKKHKKARSWDSKADRIKQAGVDRMLGLRSDGPVRKELDEMVVKALLKPTGAVIGNAVRAGSVARMPSGKVVYRRGGGARVVRSGQGVR